MNTLIIICGAKVSSKGFSSKSIANDAWVIENEFTEYPTMELCRTACLNAEDDCKAFAFNSEDRKCQFGTVADDPVYLTSGVNVHIDREIGLPQKCNIHYLSKCICAKTNDTFTDPHIAFFDVDQYEFSSATEGILPSKSFPEFAPHVANRDMIAVMVYDNRGFFACTFNDDPDYCGFNAFGSAIWEPWPMYSSEPSPRSNPAHVQLGSTSMWVLGGRYHDTTEIFSDGAWKFGPDLPTAECSRRELFNAVKISNAEVLIFGGSCGGVAHTETSYTYNFATGEWIRRGDLSEGKVGTSFLNDVITLTNGTKVVVAVGGYDITNLGKKILSTVLYF